MGKQPRNVQKHISAVSVTIRSDDNQLHYTSHARAHTHTHTKNTSQNPVNKHKANTFSKNNE